jgi:hypothetical protein
MQPDIIDADTNILDRIFIALLLNHLPGFIGAHYPFKLGRPGSGRVRISLSLRVLRALCGN